MLGCGSSADQNSESSIYGGTKTAAGSFQNVVSLTQSNMGIFCTGTAITPTVVVTAAHCAEAMEYLAAVQVYVGSGVSGGAYLGQYSIKKANANPRYASGQGDYDVSYVVLTKPLTLPASAYIPVATNKSELAELLKKGKTARIVGYGERNNGDVGVKYQVDAAISAASSTEIAIGGNGKDSCQGDSGGPAFGQLANGQWRQVGVVSYGGQCGQGGVYGILAASICWVQKDSGVNLGLATGTCSTSSSVAKN
jgi:secreted trypsin-like serine protease